ncbi:hypothetical protein QN277_019923 [Acacia crassicarpa]|uniref:Uncharacterized protein n=1 Tax=Acacia crassicarpa TaxID=499986 RepID=A0AAE1MS87_9FABA|nr:hypothetical protein QN277_019923 [Acacia crassicarpa]
MDLKTLHRATIDTATILLLPPPSPTSLSPKLPPPSVSFTAGLYPSGHTNLFHLCRSSSIFQYSGELPEHCGTITISLRLLQSPPVLSHFPSSSPVAACTQPRPTSFQEIGSLCLSIAEEKGALDFSVFLPPDHQ